MRLLIRDVRLIDGVGDAVRDGVDVVIDGERIVEVADHDPRRPGTDGETVVEGARRTLLPGLIDAHAHYTFDPTEGSLQAIARRSDAEILAAAAAHAALALRAGVTTARGAGSIRNLEVVLRDRIAAGEVIGPRLVVAGTAVGCVGGHGSAFGLEADGPDALADATRRVVLDGADVVKAVASEAAMLTTTGLPPGAMVHGAPELTEAELRAIVATAGRARAARDVPRPGRRVGPPLRRGRRRVGGARVARRRGGDRGSGAVGCLARADARRDRREPNVARPDAGLSASGRTTSSGPTGRRRKPRSGWACPLATGTDTGEVGVTADMVWREIALLADHGLPAMAAIRAATSSAARLLGLEAEVGSIETGKLADLVLVDGDPLADLAVLGRPVAVWRGGTLVSA